MKFGGKQTMADKVAVAARNKSGKAMDSKPVGKPKVKPVIGKNKVGVKATWKF